MKNLIPIKIKFNREESQNFLAYLTEIVSHYDNYLKVLTYSPQLYELMYEALLDLRETLIKFIFQKRNEPKEKKYLFTISKSERLSLLNLIDFYPLPTYLTNLDFEIKNGLYI